MHAGSRKLHSLYQHQVNMAVNYRDCKLNFKSTSMQRWQYLIYYVLESLNEYEIDVYFFVSLNTEQRSTNQIFLKHSKKLFKPDKNRMFRGLNMTE